MQYHHIGYIPQTKIGGYGRIKTVTLIINSSKAIEDITKQYCWLNSTLCTRSEVQENIASWLQIVLPVVLLRFHFETIVLLTKIVYIIHIHKSTSIH